jgi:hypothetical protein
MVSESLMQIRQWAVSSETMVGCFPAGSNHMVEEKM